MSMEYVLSYDLGTSGVKATLVDCSGVLCATEMETYPLYTPRESFAEQKPQDYWDAVCASTKRLLVNTGTPAASIIGIALCSQWKGIIALDQNDRVLHNSITWLDARATAQAKSMNRVLQVNYYKEKLFGFKPSSRLNAALGREILCAADYWPKLMWLREELPEVYAKTKTILECSSYVKWRATGKMSCDLTMHFTKSFNKSTQSFYDLILKLAKVDAGLFPDITETTDQVGEISVGAAEELGLQAGTPVFGGCGDIPGIAIGSASFAPGDTNVYFGSSGWLSSVVQCKEGFLSTSPFSKENDLLCFGFQGIGLAFDWALRQFYGNEYHTMGADVYGFIEKDLAGIPAGSAGLLATHWMYGERPPFFSDSARGAFVNLNGTHDRRHMLNAMMESICYSMKMSLTALIDGTRRDVPYINAVGGCAANDYWMQMLADVLGIAVNIPEHPRHAGAIGAAYCALIGLGKCRGFSEARERIKIEKTFLPRLEISSAHQKNFTAYSALHKTLKSTFVSLK